MPRHDANTFDPSSKRLNIVRIIPKPGQKELGFNPDLLVFNRSKPEPSERGSLLNIGDSPRLKTRERPH